MTAPDKALHAEDIEGLFQVEKDNSYKEKQWETTKELSEAANWGH